MQGHSRPLFLRRGYLLGAAAIPLLFLGYLAVDPAGGEDEAPSRAVPGVLVHEEDGFRYTYHVVTDTEGLFDLGSDPRCLKNLAPVDPLRTVRLRLQLSHRLGVRNLNELRGVYQPAIQKLRGLGYL